MCMLSSNGLPTCKTYFVLQITGKYLDFLSNSHKIFLFWSYSNRDSLQRNVVQQQTKRDNSSKNLPESLHTSLFWWYLLCCTFTNFKEIHNIPILVEYKMSLFLCWVSHLFLCFTANGCPSLTAMKVLDQANTWRDPEPQFFWSGQENIQLSEDKKHCSFPKRNYNWKVILRSIVSKFLKALLAVGSVKTRSMLSLPLACVHVGRGGEVWRWLAFFLFLRCLFVCDGGGRVWWGTIFLIRFNKWLIMC